MFQPQTLKPVTGGPPTPQTGQRSPHAPSGRFWPGGGPPPHPHRPPHTTRRRKQRARAVPWCSCGGARGERARLHESAAPRGSAQWSEGHTGAAPRARRRVPRARAAARGVGHKRRRQGREGRRAGARGPGVPRAWARGARRHSGACVGAAGGGGRAPRAGAAGAPRARGRRRRPPRRRPRPLRAAPAPLPSEPSRAPRPPTCAAPGRSAPCGSGAAAVRRRGGSRARPAPSRPRSRRGPTARLWPNCDPKGTSVILQVQSARNEYNKRRGVSQQIGTVQACLIAAPQRSGVRQQLAVTLRVRQPIFP